MFYTLESEYIDIETKKEILDKAYKAGKYIDGLANHVHDLRLSFYYENTWYLIDMLNARYYTERANGNKYINDFFISFVIEDYRDRLDFEVINDKVYGVLLDWAFDNFELKKIKGFLEEYKEKQNINWVNTNNNKFVIEEINHPDYDYYLAVWETSLSLVYELLENNKYKGRNFIIDRRFSRTDQSFIKLNANEDKYETIIDKSKGYQYTELEGIANNILKRHIPFVDNSILPEKIKMEILGDYYFDY